MSWTTSSYPAFCRFAAMPLPMVPSPIKPTFILFSCFFVIPGLDPGISCAFERWPGHPRTRSGASHDEQNSVLVEHVLGDEGRGHCRGPAGIKGEVSDDFAELGLAVAVLQRAFEMTDQLLLAAERDQRGDDDQAAVALRQLGAL